MADEFLTTKQVTERWPFLSASTLRYWRHADIGPASFAVQGKVLYRVSAVEHWLAEQEKSTIRGGAA
ncbi:MULTISPECIES: helix-turn-helix transcriptional regulator [Gordonia]|uniref:helix-turn-helix transcriptional regulator n=1 Tax=Gordonia TaxID=2053 RepID=UPI002447CAD8|nr:DNA-binding protein [Gordonia alkanivorans]MDH3007085.1 DNA-binding protein [Gordonia alkanivorans]MDH3015041.1 DNA-binding protein [Gordonia alkanivorans]MDH3021628.1 DNA-binding protein [Gordonia alkanivorans]MDH3040149.1 DNA-binding protein [Gordonia alkanivorans]MDH3059407.1 DNA-binding protein [Gordonia alkanivorans]